MSGLIELQVEHDAIPYFYSAFHHVTLQVQTQRQACFGEQYELRYPQVYEACVYAVWSLTILRHDRETGCTDESMSKTPITE